VETGTVLQIELGVIRPAAMPPIFQSLPLWFQFTLVAVPAFSAIFAASALVLNILQSRRTNAQARAALVAECLKDFANDEDIQRAFYAIEYNEFVYDSRFHKSDQEREIDKLLRHFANLALSWKSGLLSIEDVRPVQYYILRVMKNPEILKYMEFMTEWLKRSNSGQHPYAVLGELCDTLVEASR
jgi:hypothetical protein